MSEAAQPQDEPFGAEPRAQGSGSQPPALRRRRGRWPWKQGLPGLLALAEGLGLLGLFGFAPWFSWTDVHFILGLILTQASEDRMQSIFGLHPYSGWAAAWGVSIPDQSSPVFGYLWLIPLLGVGLVALAGLHQRRSISARLTLTALLALSGLALMTEAGLYVQVQSLQGTPATSLGREAYLAASVLWGFCCAVGITIAAIVAGVVLLKPALPRLHPLRSAATFT